MAHKKELKLVRTKRILAELRALYDKDPEYAHTQADALLLELIDNPEITRAFNHIQKWYS